MLLLLHYEVKLSQEKLESRKVFRLQGNMGGWWRKIFFCNFKVKILTKINENFKLNVIKRLSVFKWKIIFLITFYPKKSLWHKFMLTLKSKVKASTRKIIVKIHSLESAYKAISSATLPLKIKTLQKLLYSYIRAKKNA